MSKRRTTLFSAALIAVTSMAIGMVIASRFDMAPASSAQTQPVTTPPMNSDPLSGPIDAGTFRRIAETQTAMVVNIRTESRRSTDPHDFFGGDDLFRRFHGQPAPEQEPREQTVRAAGTGFVIEMTGADAHRNPILSKRCRKFAIQARRIGTWTVRSKSRRLDCKR